ncbi:uncharacterized protein CLUP02_06852 [Colletotrichum lupini]|uniref:Uncharacterized protein n=1 Tax=Colletotrichum lupini TaxID=145971 RepID=A0A9Q8WFI0_9PEZI|nr:uncharacterized protein CLUP02_06852 [Colletotrichum lupini]UQC81366.1 hypothetical protein CLUP02_06852 [Colletotrichum lupini]
MAKYPKMEIYDNVIAAFKDADDENIIDRTLINRRQFPAPDKRRISGGFFAGTYIGVVDCDRPPKLDTPDDAALTPTCDLKPKSTEIYAYLLKCTIEFGGCTGKGLEVENSM